MIAYPVGQDRYIWHRMSRICMPLSASTADTFAAFCPFTVRQTVRARWPAYGDRHLPGPGHRSERAKVNFVKKRSKSFEASLRGARSLISADTVISREGPTYSSHHPQVSCFDWPRLAAITAVDAISVRKDQDVNWSTGNHLKRLHVMQHQSGGTQCRNYGQGST